MGNFIFGAVTATMLSYAYVMFGWTMPAFLELPDMIGSIVSRLKEATERVQNWEVDAGGFEAIEPGLSKTYHRARR